MKKAFLLFAVMMTMTLGAVAQNGNGNNQLINKARVAANQAGCFSGWNGQVSAQVTVVSSCFAGGFVTEVLFVPVCHGQGCDTVRLAPLAKVTFYCTDDVVGSVECL
ncbi:MAG: hypothetical protein ACJASQ_003617 [Crocinitomicaceae bacterium]|jgi:hypothetical protein